MRYRASAVAVGVVVLSTALASQASWVLDQEAPAEMPPAPFTFAVGGPTEQVLFQTVTAGLDGRLRAVEVPIGCDSGTVILEIRDVDALGQPGPTVLATHAFAASDFPAFVDDTFQRLRLRGMPLRFAAGDTFTIALSNPTGSCGIWPGPEGDAYSGGTGWADGNDGPLVPLGLGSGREDMPFRTFVQ
jgi:hypothetical protein